MARQIARTETTIDDIQSGVVEAFAKRYGPMGIVPDRGECAWIRSGDLMKALGVSERDPVTSVLFDAALLDMKLRGMLYEQGEPGDEIAYELDASELNRQRPRDYGVLLQARMRHMTADDVAWMRGTGRWSQG